MTSKTKQNPTNFFPIIETKQYICKIFPYSQQSWWKINTASGWLFEYHVYVSIYVVTILQISFHIPHILFKTKLTFILRLYGHSTLKPNHKFIYYYCIPHVFFVCFQYHLGIYNAISLPFTINVRAYLNWSTNKNILSARTTVRYVSRKKRLLLTRNEI